MSKCRTVETERPAGMEIGFNNPTYSDAILHVCIESSSPTRPSTTTTMNSETVNQNKQDSKEEGTSILSESPSSSSSNKRKVISFFFLMCMVWFFLCSFKTNRMNATILSIRTIHCVIISIHYCCMVRVSFSKLFFLVHLVNPWNVRCNRIIFSNMCSSP